MAPILYLMYESPPARAVLITAKAIGLTLVEKEIDIFAGDLATPEFLKLNPQHTIPTFVDDDGFVLWDSHAIMIYILSKYAKNSALYPKDSKKQALVHQRLHFDTGVANGTLLRLVKPLFYEGKNFVDQKGIDDANEVYGFVEAFLEDKQWIAGDSVTIADYSIQTNLTGLNILVPLDAQKFPKVAAWVKRCKELPEFEVDPKGLKMYEKLLHSKLK